MYFTAGVGVVFNKEAKAQRFFVGHTDDIVSLAIDPTRTIVATGQVKSKGAAPPFVCVWDANSMQQLQRLNLKKHEGDPAVTALSFSHDGSLLVCIQRDIDHHISVWHWSTATKLMEDKSLKGPAPGGIPMIFGISWNNHVRADPNKEVQKYDFCTYGVKWLSFWKLPKVVKDGSARYNRAKMQKIGTFTDLGANQPDYKVRTGTGDLPSLSHHKCAVWLPNGDCVSGTKEGEIWLWRDTQYVWHSQAHKTALSVLTLRADGTRLLSGSLNGTIIEWNVQGATPQPISRRTIAPPHADPDPRLPGIKALDCYPGSDIYVVGTTQSDIYEVDNDPEPVVVGHSDRLDAVAPNPVRPDEYATACYSGRWFVWDARQRRPTLTRSIENEQATCIAYSPSGDEIAIGLASGSWKVYNTQHLAYAKEYTPGRPSNKNSATGLPILEEQVRARASRHARVTRSTRRAEPSATRPAPCSRRASQGIACVKYCPTGRTLALGSYDQLIYLYDVAPELARTEATVASRERYRRIGKCVGHSSSVTRLDWDRTGKLLQSNSTANEHLYWWGRSGTEQELRDLHLWAEGRETPPKPGEQLTEAQREYTQWDTWSSILGFPVMGIFPQGMALEKMNVVAVSRGTGGPRDPDKPARRGQVVLGSTDHGDVLAFNFPAVINRAPYHRYDGHSSFVKNVCWLGDDARVVSVGGGDRAMLQWAVKWEAAGDGARVAGARAPTRRVLVPMGRAACKAPRSRRRHHATAAADSLMPRGCPVPYCLGDPCCARVAGFGYQPPDAAAQVTTVGAQHAAAHAKGRDAAPAAPAQLAPPPSARPPAAGNTAPATRAAQSESDEQLQKQQQEAKVARLEAQIRAMEEQQKAMQEQQRALSNELQSLKPAS